MKWLIASDIHGSAEYCRMLIDAYRSEGADKLLLLGDILYHGPRNDLPALYEPKQVIQMLNGIKDDILCVRGNCDSEVDQMVLQFSIMADYAVITYGKRLIFATHGHIYNSNSLLPMKKDDILLHGHTHVPAKRILDDHIYLNPGSVSIPKNDSDRSYMTFENGVFIWKTLSGKQYDTFVIE